MVRLASVELRAVEPALYGVDGVAGAWEAEFEDVFVLDEVCEDDELVPLTVKLRELLAPIGLPTETE